tara:strand:+ start:251 stop:565 length:315 start_codon:yes stop_codon:yes gene_type:complete
MKKIDRDTAKKYIYATNGKFFSAVFRKKDGEIRSMTCRLKVKKHVKGIGRTFKPQNRGLIGVFDIHVDGHRFINLMTLKRLKIKGVKYLITNNKTKGVNNENRQ